MERPHKSITLTATRTSLGNVHTPDGPHNLQESLIHIVTVLSRRLHVVDPVFPSKSLRLLFGYLHTSAQADQSLHGAEELSSMKPYLHCDMGSMPGLIALFVRMN